MVVCDLRMHDGDGLEVLRAVGGLEPGCPFVLMTAYATAPTVVQAMREGPTTTSPGTSTPTSFGP